MMLSRLPLIRLLFLFLLVLAPPAIAQEDVDESADPRNQFAIQDSVFFTLDDGVMTRAEMEQEAQYIFGQCGMNPYRSLYFDCECLSGAFLLERERLGPTVPQFEIMEQLTRSGKSACANTANMAGESYRNCMEMRRTFFAMASPERNEEICSCAGRKAAFDFSERPVQSPSYTASLMSEAMVYCEDPENRKRIAASVSGQGAEPAASQEAPPLIPPKAETN
jgi:hypothetical protein